MPAATPSEHSRPIPILLSGFGPVGKEFFNRIRAHHGKDFYVAGIRGRMDEVRLGPDTVLPDRAHWNALTSIAEFLQQTSARILVQAIPSSPEAHPRAVDEAITALRHGVDLVTATKNHLLTHWKELEAAAQAGGSRIRISGATGAALPTADLARTGVKGLDCRSIRACPNGTSTFVLDRMDQGMSLEDAVSEAQRLGIAEANTSADLSGSDAATKTSLIAGLLWGWDVSKISVGKGAIDENSVRRARTSASSSQRLRAVATASVDQPLIVTVRLEAVGSTDPLFHLSGPEKAMTFYCPEAGNITVQGGRSSPAGAGLALVKDVLNLLPARTSGFR
ncbi:homoserine dehydrogenase [Arthrobacter alpinus]|uniref:homoserine dehydrogenase n=1 Tax=Arthrobacter alpinus TaxID=656366 RepID=UPI0005CA7B05|nr:homoserine dehydrogenase [Arthrobacter alpinus]